MKVEESLVKKIYVSEIEALDPITILVEDFGEGHAEVIIKCWDKSWTAYWGAMGGDVKEFFSRVNVSYLVNCFDRGIRSESDEKDVSAMKETFEQKIREYILERRRDTYLDKQVARDLWEEVDKISFESIVPEHDHECFNWDVNHWSVDYNVWSKLFYGIDYDLGDFGQWLWENVPFEYMPNHEYHYLERIITVVKDVVSGGKCE